jgi:hypothetical protein
MVENGAANTGEAIPPQPAKPARPWLKKWQPGQSGNPKGRPKLPVDIRALAKERSLHAFRRIVELIDSDDERVALAAAKEVLDRAWGKASAADEDGGGRPVTINIVRFDDRDHAAAQLEAPAVSIRAVAVPGARG